MRKIACFCLVATLAAPAPAHAWGAVAHRYLTARLIDILPAEIKPFFDANRAELVLRSNDPDLWRVVGFEDEPPNHQIDLGVDDYGPYPFTVLPREYSAAVQKFGVTTVRRHGLLPWRTTEEYGNLVRVFEGISKKQLYADTNAVWYAAALVHYIEDATQPFHVHNNFDGQLSNQNGIHSRFEAELFERFEQRLKLAPPPRAPPADASAFIWAIALDSFQLAPTILEADKAAVAGKTVYDDDYFEKFFTGVQPVLERQLSRAVSDAASAIVAAWQEAGRPVLARFPRQLERVRTPR